MVLLFFFPEKAKCYSDTKKICALYDEGTVDDCTCFKRHTSFRANNFKFNDAPRFVQSTDADDNELFPLFVGDPHTKTQGNRENLGVNLSTVSRRLQQIGVVIKTDVYMPYESRRRN